MVKIIVENRNLQYYLRKHYFFVKIIQGIAKGSFTFRLVNLGKLTSMFQFHSNILEVWLHCSDLYSMAHTFKFDINLFFCLNSSISSIIGHKLQFLTVDFFSIIYCIELLSIHFLILIARNTFYNLRYAQERYLGNIIDLQSVA